MKTIFITLIYLATISVLAAPAEMSQECETKVRNEIGVDGSVQTSTDDIVTALKLDWKNNPTKETVSFGDCGPSDYFEITVEKASCEIKAISWGDSDGECY